MYFLVILLCVFLFWSSLFYGKKWRLFKLSWNVPGPMVLPFIGSSYVFFNENAADIAKRFGSLFEKYPDFAKFWIANDLFYLVTKPEYVEIILNHPGACEKIDFYKYTKPMIGDGLLSGPVKIWKKHRKIIAPSLNQKILNEYVEAISQQCNILIEKFQKNCGKGQIDHCYYITNCAIDIVADTIFGVPINAQNTNSNYSEMIDKMMEIVFLRAFRLPYHCDFIFYRTKHFKEFTEIVTKIKEVSREVIRSKKEQLAGQIEMEDVKKKPFLDIIVEKYLNNEFSLEELEDEVNTFLLAGSDTNATISSFILTVLGIHQDVQEKVYEEAIAILDSDRPVTLDDLSKLKYTERVIKETLRLFPGAPFIARIVEEDIHLDDTIIPKGSNVCIGYLHLHRTEKYWKDPFKFDPDRFLPENSTNRHPYTWLPFSGGPRNCIGLKFGMMVTKILTVMVIRKFKVTTPIKSIQDIELTTNIVLKPKEGFRLSFELR